MGQTDGRLTDGRTLDCLVTFTTFYADRVIVFSDLLKFFKLSLWSGAAGDDLWRERRSGQCRLPPAVVRLRPALPVWNHAECRARGALGLYRARRGEEQSLQAGRTGKPVS